ncbi:unnamed protein product, partial [Symbiodinium necroappetens]
FQLQLKQNERFIEDAQARVTNAERLCARLQRAALTAQRESDAAVIRAEAAEAELDRLQQKRHPLGATFDDVDLLRQRQGVLEAERASLSAELRQHREDAEELAAKSVAARRRELQLRSKLEAARQRCTTEKREIEQRHTKEREAFVHEMQAELQAVAAATENEVAMLTAQQEEEVRSLRRAEAAAAQRHSAGASRSEAAAAESAARLQETQSLRRLCEHSSGEVSRLSAELRAMQAAGFDLQDLEDSTDSEVERETDFFRARCESIERRCARALRAASRKEFDKVPPDLSFTESLDPVSPREISEPESREGSLAPAESRKSRSTEAFDLGTDSHLHDPAVQSPRQEAKALLAEQNETFAFVLEASNDSVEDSSVQLRRAMRQRPRTPRRTAPLAASGLERVL